MDYQAFFARYMKVRSDLTSISQFIDLHYHKANKEGQKLLVDRMDHCQQHLVSMQNNLSKFGTPMFSQAAFDLDYNYINGSIETLRVNLGAMFHLTDGESLAMTA